MPDLWAHNWFAGLRKSIGAGALSMEANKSIGVNSALLTTLPRPVIIGDLRHSDITEQGGLITCGIFIGPNFSACLPWCLLLPAVVILTGSI